jgi:hypothetical protein
LLSFQCRHWRTSSSAHTYRLLVVKEPAKSVCRRPGIACQAGCREALCSSAAEKRDYAALAAWRQSFFVAALQKTAVRPCPFLSPAALFCGRGRTIAKLSTSAQEMEKRFFARFSQLISVNFFVLF